MGSKVYISQNIEIDKECPICREKNKVHQQCLSCNQEICVDCIVCLMELGNPCPYCRGNKGYTKVTTNKVVKNKTQKTESQEIRHTTIPNIESRVYCPSNNLNWELNPWIKKKGIVCINIISTFVIVFGIGIISRLIFSIMLPMFAQSKIIIIECLLTLLIGILTIIFASFIVLIIGCVCIPTIFNLLHRD